jgi:hypothetical protein
MGGNGGCLMLQGDGELWSYMRISQLVSTSSSNTPAGLLVGDHLLAAPMGVSILCISR